MAELGYTDGDARLTQPGADAAQLSGYCRTAFDWEVHDGGEALSGRLTRPSYRHLGRRIEALWADPAR